MGVLSFSGGGPNFKGENNSFGLNIYFFGVAKNFHLCGSFSFFYLSFSFFCFGFGFFGFGLGFFCFGLSFEFF